MLVIEVTLAKTNYSFVIGDQTGERKGVFLAVSAVTSMIEKVRRAMHHKRLVLVLMMAGLLLSLSAIAHGLSTVSQQTPDRPRRGYNVDNLPNPLADRQAALRRQAAEQKIREPLAGAPAQPAPGQFVDMSLAGEARYWAVPAEFGNAIHPTYGGVPGPRHNQIPEPDRDVDNTTFWRPDFNQAYYNDLLLSDAAGALSLRHYFAEQSGGLYAITGGVENWGQVTYNAARYGHGECGDVVCPDVWLFLRHSLQDWYGDQRNAGQTMAQINNYLSTYDVYDRYDYDGDGNFDEPDGYIDNFQSVFAGQSDDQGLGDAIATHRWYAYHDEAGLSGPSFNKAGGVRVGNSNYWVGDYTMTAENTALGTIAYFHARGLGLPQLFDAGSFPLGNMTGYWTLMSQGSQATDGQNGLGNKPVNLGAWEKLQLGWLEYDVAQAGERSRHRLGPAATTDFPQAIVVNLPDKVVVIDNGEPHDGERFYQSPQQENRDDRMAREFDLPAGATLSAYVRYQLEQDWDYAYVVVSNDGGATWTNLDTNLSTDDDPNGQNAGHGITGSSGGVWVEVMADLSAYTGPTLVGFRHVSDAFFAEGPFDVDDITISGSPTDGAESDTGWTFDPPDGFSAVVGSEVLTYFNAYIAELRVYRGFDGALQTGPSCYCFLDTSDMRNRVLHYPYQDGLLISYWDGSQSDNNYGDHQGSGLILPIDAHPELLKFDVNGYWPDTVQSYDATFGRQRTETLTLIHEGQTYHYPSQKATAVFDDNKQYWDPTAFLWQVRHPDTNTQIRVKSENRKSGVMVVDVRPTP